MMDDKTMKNTEKKLFRHTLAEARSLMKSVAKKEKKELCFMSADDGHGGYNYGASTFDSIMIAPFVKAKKGDKIGRYAISQDCDNPVECMLVTFFHELAHASLTDKVPSVVKGYSWNDTSQFQFELWITMLGIEYAHKECGLKFSDQAVKWLIEQNMGYIREPKEADEIGYGLVCKKATAKSYEVVSQWEFTGDKEKPKKVKKVSAKDAFIFGLGLAAKTGMFKKNGW